MNKNANCKIDSEYSEHLRLEIHDFHKKFKMLNSENKGLKLNYLARLEINRLFKERPFQAHNAFCLLLIKG